MWLAAEQQRSLRAQERDSLNRVRGQPCAPSRDLIIGPSAGCVCPLRLLPLTIACMCALLQVLLNSRVEHDNSAGSSVVEPSVARSASGRSATELDSQSVAASQTSALEHYNRKASPGTPSASSARSGGPGRSNSARSEESNARRVSAAAHQYPLHL